VQSMPTDMVLSASPGSLVCDGTATSAVSANLTDDEGNPAVDGNVVHFQAKALGSVSPIEPASAGGAATTTLTPLSGLAGGVSVGATLTLEPIDWQYLLRHYRELIDPGLLQKLETNNKVIDWRSVLDQCRNSLDDDNDDVVNDGCPEVGDSSEKGAQCDNRRDDDGDGYVNDGCPAVGAAETYVPMADEVTIERNLLVACSEAAPAEIAPAPAPAGVPAIAPPATGDGGFLGR
jgi:hypothetical protein